MVTTIEKMEKMLQELFSALNSHDVEKWTSHYTDDGILDDIGLGTIIRGKNELKTYAKNMFSSFPDAKFETKSSIKSGNWVAIEWVMSGTHTGDYPGLPATGKKFSFRGVSLIEYRNDKISRETLYWNMAAFLQQVGLMPATPAK